MCDVVVLRTVVFGAVNSFDLLQAAAAKEAEQKAAPNDKDEKKRTTAESNPEVRPPISLCCLVRSVLYCFIRLPQAQPLCLLTLCACRCARVKDDEEGDTTETESCDSEPLAKKTRFSRTPARRTTGRSEPARSGSDSDNISAYAEVPILE
jgi:hypothetical protein